MKQKYYGKPRAWQYVATWGIMAAIVGLVLDITWEISPKIVSRSFAQPIEKRGQCPAGWASSAHYCVPPSTQSGKTCLWKAGQCPSGMISYGAYCCLK
jgi:hypothetical protein